MDDGVELRTGHDGHDGFEVRHAIGFQRGGVLRVAQITGPRHAQVAVEPRLALDPVDGGAAIPDFVRERIEFAVRFVTAARVLRDDVIAALGQPAQHEAVDQADRPAAQFAAIRRADQDRGEAAFRFGVVVIGRQRQAVLHFDGNVALDADGVRGG